MTGIILGAAVPGYLFIAAIIAAASAMMIIRDIRYHSRAAISPLILLAALGYIAIQHWVCPRLPDNHISRFCEDQYQEITGIVAEEPVNKNNRLRFVLNTEMLMGVPVTGKLRLTSAPNETEIHCGDRISVQAKIRTPRNFHNPGGFDYERYLAFQKIWATAYAKQIVIVEKNADTGIRWRIEKIRLKISEFMRRHGEGKDETELLRALIIGDQSSISESVYDDFRRTGTAHLIAVSGLNIGIIAMLSFRLFRWFLSRFKFFLFRAWTKKGAFLLSLFPTAAYVLISGMAPPALRSFWMVIVFLAATFFEKEQDSVNTLAFAALIILSIDPPSLFSVSFQLSFAAIFWIVYPMSEMPKTPRLRILTSSTFAILGTLPIVSLYFNQCSIIGLLANLFFIPVFGYVIVPLGLSSVFLYPLSESIASWIVILSNRILKFNLILLDILADIPLASVRTVTPSYLEIILYYLMFAALLNWKKKAAKITAALVLIAAIGDVGYWCYERYWNPNLRVTFIDVGQGNSALIEMPEGHCMLIDGGGLEGSAFDIGSAVVAPFLWQKKIVTIDTMVMSHPHQDHAGGLHYIAENFDVKRLWMNGQEADSENYRKFMETIRNRNISVPKFADIFGLHDINGVAVKILYPQKDFQGFGDENNNSLVLKLEFGKISFLFPGDIKKEGERELVETSGTDLKSTVLLAPHHGSRTSGSKIFLESVNPEYLVISVGWKNRFHLPNSKKLKEYQSRQIPIFRTDMNGAIVFSTDGKILYVCPAISSF